MNVNDPIPEAWGSYVTQTNLGLEVIPAPLYSTKNYVSAVTTKLVFFDTVQGARPDLTNMQTANQLSLPESFLIQAIRTLYKGRVQSDDSGTGDSAAVPSNFDDVVQLCQTGIFTMKISNKQYGPWPLDMLAAGNFPMMGGFASGSDVLVDYAQVGGPLYSLFPNLMIGPLQNFQVTLEWPGGPVTLSTGAESELPIRILFDGQLARAIS